MTTPVVFVAGPDPINGMGGHSSYIRAHGRAALRAGFEPHIVCVGVRDEVVPTEFGIVYRVKARVPLERIRAVRVRQHQLIWRVSLLARAVVRLVLAHPGARLIHSFGSYGCVGVAAQNALRRKGMDTLPMVGAYDTLVREGRAKLQGARAHGVAARISFGLELLWNTVLVQRYERRCLREARLVVVNYESVRRLLAEDYGIADRVRIIPYSSEVAFLDGRGRSPLPSRLAMLGPPEVPLVVAVSRQDPRKGLDVLLEALQAGAAVVASNVDGIPEDVEEGTSALLVPPSDSLALTHALKRLLMDPGLRRRLAQQARATFEARFSADRFSAALRSVYADLGITP